jgi:RNA polymerase sigma-70 factor (ECF subfamily)
VSDDTKIIEAALRGDSEAFGQLVRKYQDRLFNTINMVHMADCSHAADDIVQEAFVRAFVKLHTFRGRSSFYTWLYRIAFNILSSRKRRKKAEVSINHQQRVSGEEPLDQSGSPEDRLHRKELSNQVQSALAALNDEYRAILVLREMENCDYEEIAEVLQLPIGTVRSRLHRARSQLRRQMKAVYDEMLAQ